MNDPTMLFKKDLLWIASNLATATAPPGADAAAVAQEVQRWYFWMEGVMIASNSAWPDPPALGTQGPSPVSPQGIAGALASLDTAGIAALGQQIATLGTKGSPLATVLVPVLQSLLGAASTGPIPVPSK